jgi:adenosylcobinamide-GDP ribazoletransferase
MSSGAASDAAAAAERHSVPPLAGWRALLRDLAQMVRFYSRLPVPKLPFEADAHAIPDFRVAPRMLPLAGLIIGVPGAAILWLACSVGLPPLMAAAAAVAVCVLATGALHEDGLADTFDGLAGGTTPETRLAIMKDSRVGSSGATALMLSLMLRTAGLAGLAEALGGGPAASLMVAAAGLSRPLGLTPLAMLPPARPSGVSSAVGRPTAATFVMAVGVGLAAAGGLSSLAGTHFAGAGLGAVLGLGLALAMTWWALHALRGQTGDVAGACQQLAEIAFYCGVLIVLKQGGA